MIDELPAVQWALVNKVQNEIAYSVAMKAGSRDSVGLTVVGVYTRGDHCVYILGDCLYDPNDCRRSRTVFKGLERLNRPLQKRLKALNYVNGEGLCSLMSCCIRNCLKELGELLGVKYLVKCDNYELVKRFGPKRLSNVI